MKKNSFINNWCDRLWIKFSLMISAIVIGEILLNWDSWDTAVKSLLATAAILPLHVVEEWVFPGGFHYQYNITMKSDIPDRYPMCRFTDMITNLFGTFAFIVMGITCLYLRTTYYSFVIAGIGFAFLELLVHTLFGIKMYKMFKAKGKSTIYGPGSITTYYGFVPVGVVLSIYLSKVTLASADILYGIAITVLMLVIGILLPENLLKKRDNAYAFRTNGYFDRFLQ